MNMAAVTSPLGSAAAAAAAAAAAQLQHLLLRHSLLLFFLSDMFQNVRILFSSLFFTSMSLSAVTNFKKFSTSICPSVFRWCPPSLKFAVGFGVSLTIATVLLVSTLLTVLLTGRMAETGIKPTLTWLIIVLQKGQDTGGNWWDITGFAGWICTFFILSLRWVTPRHILSASLVPSSSLFSAMISLYVMPCAMHSTVVPYDLFASSSQARVSAHGFQTLAIQSELNTFWSCRHYTIN